jgi:hypothetical protein
LSRAQRKREEAEALYPALAQFLGGYLHEDWDIFSGTPEKAVDQAIGETPVERRQQVRREMVRLLEGSDDDTLLRDTLNDGLGVNLYFREPSEARTFAEEVERKLLASIKSHFRRDPKEKDKP